MILSEKRILLLALLASLVGCSLSDSSSLRALGGKKSSSSSSAKSSSRDKKGSQSSSSSSSSSESSTATGQQVVNKKYNGLRATNFVEDQRFWDRLLQDNVMSLVATPSTTSEPTVPAPADEGTTPNVLNLDIEKDEPTTTTIPMDPGDLQIRFNKIVFMEETPLEATTMTPALYPISVETAEWLSQSQCPSVIAEANCVECQETGMTVQEHVQLIGGYPLHPINDSSSPYWDELRRVVEIQLLRRDNTVPPGEIMCLPLIWNGMDLQDVAEAVHDEYPGYHQSQLVQTFMRYNIPVDTNIIPPTCQVEFIRGIVMLAHLNTWAVAQVGAVNFATKYDVGRARPEELAWKIAQGELTTANGVPQDLVDAIEGMNLTSQFDFTAYPEGSPMHPSWPAMHSAASSASLWMSVVLNLSEAQLCEAKKVDYAVSFGRTVAGVHFETDNIAGLNLGQELIASVLAQHLVDNYGADYNTVQAKIDSLRFDWADFPDSTCALSRQATPESLQASS